MHTQVHLSAGMVCVPFLLLSQASAEVQGHTCWTAKLRRLCTESTGWWGCRFYVLCTSKQPGSALDSLCDSERPSFLSVSFLYEVAPPPPHCHQPSPLPFPPLPLFPLLQSGKFCKCHFATDPGLELGALHKKECHLPSSTRCSRSRAGQAEIFRCSIVYTALKKWRGMGFLYTAYPERVLFLDEQGMTGCFERGSAASGCWCSCQRGGSCQPLILGPVPTTGDRAPPSQESSPGLCPSAFSSVFEPCRMILHGWLEGSV